MAFNPLANFQQGQQLFNQQQDRALERFEALDKKRQEAFFQDARKGRKLLEANDSEGFTKLLRNRFDSLEKLGGDTSDVEHITQTFMSGDIDGTLAQLKQVEDMGVFREQLPDEELRQAKLDKAKFDTTTTAEKKTAKQREFEGLTEGLTEDQKKEAVLIELGLSPRAVGNAIQTISKQGIEEQIGKAKASIKQREKFGELTATRRSKVIDSGFNKIEKINVGISNIDRAVGVLNSGAGVGAIQKFLPSFRAASVELDNIQKSMALDVIGSVTFGALSQGELDLAKEVALPTGLDTPQLIEHLNKRKIAQEKLKSYYREQIDFLDQGGTVAGFLRSKDREAEEGETDAQQAPQGQSFNFDAQGNLIQ